MTLPRVLSERFWSKVDILGNCWTWGASTRKGYGRFWMDGVQHSAHRLAYEALVGPIPDGLTLDHLCRNRACVNPDHLEPVPIIVNNQRGGNKIKTHCIHGHQLSSENIYIRPNGGRQCRTCTAERSARRERPGPSARRKARKP